MAINSHVSQYHGKTTSYHLSAAETKLASNDLPSRLETSCLIHATGITATSPHHMASRISQPGPKHLTGRLIPCYIYKSSKTTLLHINTRLIHMHIPVSHRRPRLSNHYTSDVLFLPCNRKDWLASDQHIALASQVVQFIRSIKCQSAVLSCCYHPCLPAVAGWRHPGSGLETAVRQLHRCLPAVGCH
jgi:hypothetical protein